MRIENGKENLSSGVRFRLFGPCHLLSDCCLDATEPNAVPVRYKVSTLPLRASEHNFPIIQCNVQTSTTGRVEL